MPIPSKKTNASVLDGELDSIPVDELLQAPQETNTYAEAQKEASVAFSNQKTETSSIEDPKSFVKGLSAEPTVNDTQPD